MSALTMFVHAGVGLHGHEYSVQKPTAAHSSLTPSHSLLRPALRVRAEPAGVASHARSNSLQSLASPLPSPLPSPLSYRRHTTEAIPKRKVSVRFQEPATEDSQLDSTIREGNESLSESILSDQTDILGRKQKRPRVHRQFSHFVLAHPAPQLLTKQRMLVQLRPRMLLQLQEMGGYRPTPAFDILPSSLIAGSVIIPHLAKCLPGVFGIKSELGQDDILIVRSEDYSSAYTDTKKCHGRLHNRDLVAVVSPLPEQYGDSAEIAMADGSVWLSKKTSSRSYDFTKVGKDGQTETARWVRRSLPSPRTNSDSATEPSPTTSSASSGDRWTFSMIDPTSRRHPILGAMQSNELQMYHDYSIVPASGSQSPLARSFSPTIHTRERSTVLVSEEHKQLMLISACWISLRQNGWPFSPVGPLRKSSTNRKPESASNVGLGEIVSISRNSSTRRSLSKRISFPNIVCVEERRDLLPKDPVAGTGPQRALSTGAAYMNMRRKRMASPHADEVKCIPEKKEESVSMRKSSRLENADPHDKIHVGCYVKVRQITQRLLRRKSQRT